MILNNYWHMAVKAPTLMITSNPSTDGWTGITLRCTAGALDTVLYFNGGTPYNPWNYMVNTWTDVGSSTEEPVATDFRLHASNKSRFSEYTQKISTVSESGRSVTTITITGINRRNENLTIAEMGVGCSLYANYIQGSGIRSYLYVRELLQNPIIVPPNQGFSLVFEWVQQ